MIVRIPETSPSKIELSKNDLLDVVTKGAKTKDKTFLIPIRDIFLEIPWKQVMPLIKENLCSFFNLGREVNCDGMCSDCFDLDSEIIKIEKDYNNIKELCVNKEVSKLTNILIGLDEDFTLLDIEEFTLHDIVIENYICAFKKNLTEKEKSSLLATLILEEYILHGEINFDMVNM